MYYVLRFKVMNEDLWIYTGGVINASAEEVMFLSALFSCDIGPYSVRYILQCVSGMNVMFAKIKSRP